MRALFKWLMMIMQAITPLLTDSKSWLVVVVLIRVLKLNGSTSFFFVSFFSSQENWSKKWFQKYSLS